MRKRVLKKKRVIKEIMRQRHHNNPRLHVNYHIIMSCIVAPYSLVLSFFIIAIISMLWWGLYY
ncbi:unnamed protein product [Heterosigma akashiwo]